MRILLSKIRRRLLFKIRQLVLVRIRVHLSWHLAFALLTALVATQFPDPYQLWQRVIAGIIGSLVLFVAVTLRQFLLNVLAISLGVPIRNVTLFAFGGLSPVPRRSTRPIFELVLALAGIIFNLAIGGAFYWAYLNLSYPDNPLVTGLVQWLIFIWVTVIVIHLIPGYPLDGGRLVSAILWKVSRRYDRSIRIMVRSGWAAGWLLVLGGIWLMVTSEQWITGLLPAFIGWVLQSAATLSGRRVATLQALQPVYASQIMTEEFPVLSPGMTIYQIVRRHALVTGQHFFLVADEGKFLGTLTLSRIKKIRRGRWRDTLAHQVMTPAPKVKTATGEDSVASILEQMEQLRINEMPVLAETVLLGTVTRDSLLRLAKVRSALGVIAR